MKAFIYCIINFVHDKVYIGSTQRSLKVRMQNHKATAKMYRGKKSKLYIHMKKIGCSQFLILPIVEVRVNTRKELIQLEGKYIRKWNSELNYCIAGRSRQQYRDETKEEQAQRDKRWRLANVEKLKEKNRQYYQNNKHIFRIKSKEWRSKNAASEKARKHRIYMQNRDAINAKRKQHVFCGCGGRYCYNNKDKHVSTKMHIRWLAMQDDE